MSQARVGFAVRSLGDGVTPDAVVSVAEALDVRVVAFAGPPRHAAAWREALKASAIDVVAFEAAPGSLGAAIAAAAALKAGVVVVGGGAFDAPLGDLLADVDTRALRGDAIETDPVLDMRAAAREAQVERLVRGLHDALRAGVPLAVRFGRGRADVLLPEELTWVLDDLPRLGVWFDGARAERLARLGLAPAPGLLAERLAGRCVGVSMSGLRGGAGGGHPEDDGPDWSTLVETLPRRLPWIVDIDPALGRAALDDAVRFARHQLAR